MDNSVRAPLLSLVLLTTAGSNLPHSGRRIAQSELCLFVGQQGRLKGRETHRKQKERLDCKFTCLGLCLGWLRGHWDRVGRRQHKD